MQSGSYIYIEISLTIEMLS